MHLVPSMAHQLANSPKFETADLSSLMWIFSGAAYLPDKLWQRLARVAPKNVNMSEGEYPFTQLVIRNHDTC